MGTTNFQRQKKPLRTEFSTSVGFEVFDQAAHGEKLSKVFTRDLDAKLFIDELPKSHDVARGNAGISDVDVYVQGTAERLPINFQILVDELGNAVKNRGHSLALHEVVAMANYHPTQAVDGWQQA
ncbi:MAG: hypothetical protein OXG34_05700 [bacterium]|nr:hypothetical protein [bacterium]MCY3891096.1 hypothetical protein [bacterium]MCY3961143.1 hypothetical protein [bacterium]MCY4134554.1 hypothetical protein [bacterium]